MSRILIVFAFLMVLSPQVFAQKPKQFLLRDVMVVAPTTMVGTIVKTDDMTVRLWGVSPLDVGADISHIVMLESLVNAMPVNCTVKQWIGDNEATVQCIGAGEKDLALSLIERGYAMADRNAVKGTIFDAVYKNAEIAARDGREGLWNEVLPTQTTSFKERYKAQSSEFHLTNDVAYFVIAALILGPFVGMLIVGGIIYVGFRRLMNLQRYQIALAAKKDRAMREREKFIVAASLEGEMNTNRAKLDAFIIIYEELLKNLRDPLKDHKYKRSGDLIHEKPALLRNVYDSNIEKLDVLGQQTIMNLTEFYMMVEPNPKYRTIEPDTPIDDVIDFVSSIVDEAEKMLVPLDKISASLNVIVRDKRGKVA